MTVSAYDLATIRRDHKREELVTPDDAVDVFCSRCYLWEEPWPCATIRLADELDAARSRPATDPAGLDSLLERIRTETREAVIEGDANDCSSPDCIADAMYEIVRVVFRDARLSVADGPGPDATVLVEDQERPLIWVDGPEDEWFGQSLGVPDPRLERRSR